MKVASDSPRLAPEFNPFEDEYLGEILQAIALAWARMKHPRSNEIENRITNCLAGILQNDVHFRELPFDVVTQFPQLSIEGKILGQLDLRIKHRHAQRDYIAFEAKRIHVTYAAGTYRSEYREYTGEPGMGAFIEGPYSKDLPAAGMLGYVMDGDTEKAWSGLTKNIGSKRAELRLSGAESLVASTILLNMKDSLVGTRLGESLHNLTTRQLRLFHMLLPLHARNSSASMQ
jgi:hypothetical protein